MFASLLRRELTGGPGNSRDVPASRIYEMPMLTLNRSVYCSETDALAGRLHVRRPRDSFYLRQSHRVQLPSLFCEVQLGKQWSKWTEFESYPRELSRHLAHADQPQ